MEAVQLTETNAAIAEKSEINRSLKRNIGELVMEIKTNEEPKSPARKEVKVAHEIHLRREIDQWKQLVSDDGIQQSITYRDANHTDDQLEDPMDILTAEQRQFIDGACDVDKMINESREFRRKFEFSMRVNKLFVNLSNEKAHEALDLAKEQAFRAQIEDMQYGTVRFYPKINTTSM